MLSEPRAPIAERIPYSSIQPYSKTIYNRRRRCRTIALTLPFIVISFAFITGFSLIFINRFSLVFITKFFLVFITLSLMFAPITFLTSSPKSLSTPSLSSPAACPIRRRRMQSRFRLIGPSTTDDAILPIYGLSRHQLISTRPGKYDVGKGR